VRLRTLSAVLAVVLAGAGLAGCRTNVGTAATVNGHRITDSDVNKYVTPGGPNSTVAANASKSNQVVSPRSQVLQFLIQEQVFTRTLASFGKVPTDAQLAASHDEAASVLLQTQLTGAALDKAIRKGLPESGIEAKFVKVYLRVQELEYSIIQRKQLTQLPELLALVKKAGVHVGVSARYGKWNPSSLGLDGKAAVPSYLTVQPGAGGAAATPTGPAG
jgi:phosphoglycolate phosphatase-like HAD superfamily hydrolase